MTRDSLISIMGSIGMIDTRTVADLEKRCVKCDVPDGKVCRGTVCPSEDLGVRLLISDGTVTEAQVSEARALQEGLRSKDLEKQIVALSMVASRGRKATVEAAGALRATARTVSRKSSPGLPAITPEMLQKA